jgi:hypothetical protein
MDEVNEDGQVHQHESFGHGDREMGDEVRTMRNAGDSDQRQHRIDEGGHERAQRELVAEVAHEVAHHAGAELL